MPSQGHAISGTHALSVATTTRQESAPATPLPQATNPQGRHFPLAPGRAQYITAGIQFTWLAYPTLQAAGYIGSYTNGPHVTAGFHNGHPTLVFDRKSPSPAVPARPALARYMSLPAPATCLSNLALDRARPVPYTCFKLSHEPARPLRIHADKPGRPCKFL